MADITGLSFTDRVLIVGLSQVVAATILALLTINLYVRYRNRRMPAAKYITLVSLFLTLTSCMQLIGANLFEPVLGIQSFGWGLAFGMSAIANIFLYVFMLEIFSKGIGAGGAKLKIFALVEVSVAVLMPVFGPLSWFMPIFETLLLSVLMIHLLFSLALYVTLARVTTASMHKTTDGTSRRGFSLIRLAAFAIIIAYCFFVLDRVWEIVLEPEGYTVWVLLGWVSAGVSGVLLYLGFVLPSRLRRETK
ncbi:MAG: hypothetical protein WED04_12955 [Promethearchaeati archaeon SRVP18_Atabeyarchaeia-1]